MTNYNYFRAVYNPNQSPGGPARDRRLRLGLTQHFVAQAANVSQSSVSRYERSLPTSMFVEDAILDVYGRLATEAEEAAHAAGATDEEAEAAREEVER